MWSGEYIRRNLPQGRREFKSIWTGERWILERYEYWMGGPYFRRGDHTFSIKDPELKIELSAKAVERRDSLWMLAGRPIYHDNDIVRDARTDDALFGADCIYECDAGFAVRVAGKLHFTDGVRKDLPLGEIKWGEDVEFLRVSETEYSIKVGLPGRYFLLDTAMWTCRRV